MAKDAASLLSVLANTFHTIYHFQTQTHEHTPGLSFKYPKFEMNVDSQGMTVAKSLAHKLIK